MINREIYDACQAAARRLDPIIAELDKAPRTPEQAKALADWKLQRTFLVRAAWIAAGQMALQTGWPAPPKPEQR